LTESFEGDIIDEQSEEGVTLWLSLITES
jgi:hypothetical protein